MAQVSNPDAGQPSNDSFLAKERTIAPPGFNRWLVPPAALAIHLCIGMAYGFSVFWLPLSKALGIKQAIPCGPEVGFIQELFITSCDWKISTLGWMYTLFFVFLGGSAAMWGGWLERAGPPQTPFTPLNASLTGKATAAPVTKVAAGHGDAS
jgi:hypothetical protein